MNGENDVDVDDGFLLDPTEVDIDDELSPEFDCVLDSLEDDKFIRSTLLSSLTA